MMTVEGIGASPGITMGEVVKLSHSSPVIEMEKIKQPELEIEKLHSAVNSAKSELTKIKNKTFQDLGAEKAQIFEAHILMLEDPELLAQTESKISEQSVNAAWAFKSTIQEFIQVFESMEDEYLKARAADLKDVSQRVLNHLLDLPVQDLSLLDHPCILVAEDLSPSQTATMNKKMVKGFLTNIGGKTSHTAIMARTLELPAIVGLKSITTQVSSGDFVILDGSSGQVIVNPDDQQKQSYQKKSEDYKKKKAEFDQYIGQASQTQDGHSVVLAANIGSPQDIEPTLKNDAEAIGLYRTEFIFMDRKSTPTEQEQYEAYSKVIQALGDKDCIIRTLDIGGDKKLDYLHVGEEMNPFLGYRAIRICLQDQELFKTQLRALLRASVEGSLGIMFPMISSLEELLEAKKILLEVERELKQKDVHFNPQYKLGVMIEVPSAALISDHLAPHVDFFSIGTNDLTQYTCAVDRMNEKVEKLYDSFSPGLLRLIHMTIQNAVKFNIMPAMCGSMAHIKELVPLFVGMGLVEFSMSPMHILPTRQLIRELCYKDCKKLVDEVMSLPTSQQIKKHLSDFLEQKGLS